MSNSLIILNAKLSKPVSSSTLLGDLNASISEYFEEEELPVKAVILVSARLAVVWFKGIAIAEALVNRTLPLGNNTTADLEFPRSQSSNLLEVSLKKQQSSLEKVGRELLNDAKRVVGSGEIVMKENQRFVFRFDDQESAAQAKEVIENSLSKHCKDFKNVTVRNVLIKEHVVFKGHYVGPIPFSEVEHRQRTAKGRELVTYLQYRLTLMKDLEAPAILAVQCPRLGETPQQFSQHNEDIFFVCATLRDSVLLKKFEPEKVMGDGMVMFRASESIGATVKQKKPLPPPTHQAAALALAPTTSADIATITSAAATTTTLSPVAVASTTNGKVAPTVAAQSGFVPVSALVRLASPAQAPKAVPFLPSVNVDTRVGKGHVVIFW